MNIFILITAGLLPAILLWFYVWKKDKQKEPTSRLLKAVLLGAATCIPVAFVEMLVELGIFGAIDYQPSTLYDTTRMAFLVAALPEEAVKLLALWLVLRKNPFFDEHYDGIVYAVCIGLGFAAVENIFYIIGSQDEWATVAISRALLAVPGHYAFAVIMGYYYSLHHFVDHSTKNAVYILLIPVLAHGIYDALAMSSMVDETIGAICFLILIAFCIKMHKVARKYMLLQIERDETHSSAV